MAQAARTQPQGLARVNRSNPLAKNLRFAFIPGVGSIVGKYQTVVKGDAPTSGPFGRYTQKLNSGAYPTFQGDDADTGAAFSVFLLGEFASAGSFTAPVLALVATTGSDGWKLGLNSSGNLGFTAYGKADYNGSVSVLAARSIGFSATTAGNATTYLNGVARDTFAIGTLNPVSNGQFCVGSRYPQTDSSSASRLALALYFDRVLTDAEQASLAANPWQLFDAPSQSQFPTAAAAPAGVSGSITWTEASDSAAAAGSVTVSGAAAWTEAADSAALAGSAKVTAAASWTEASDAAAIAASASIAGAASWAESPDSAAIAASATVSGAVSMMEASDTLSAAGSVGSAVAINAAWTEASDTTAIAASATANASAAWTEAADTAALGGSVGNAVAINAAWTESGDSCAMLGTIRVNAAIGWAEAADGAAIAGNVAGQQAASLSWMEAADAFVMSGNVAPLAVTGAIAWTEAADCADYGLIANNRYLYTGKPRQRKHAGQQRTRIM